MTGNRKHGFRRGNGGGNVPERPWCDGCQKRHARYTLLTKALDGKVYCKRTYYTAQQKHAAMAKKDS